MLICAICGSIPFHLYLSGLGVLCGKYFFIFRIFPLDFSTPFFGLEMRVLKKYPKNPQFRPISAQFLSKSHQNARKIVNIRKSLCHHLNLLSQKHLTPFFSESPISPRVHSLPPESAFFAQKSSFERSRRANFLPPTRFFAQKRTSPDRFLRRSCGRSYRRISHPGRSALCTAGTAWSLPPLPRNCRRTSNPLLPGCYTCGI